MLNFIKKYSISGYIFFSSLVVLLISFIIFIVNSTSGYLAGKTVDPLTLSLLIISLCLGFALFFLEDKARKISPIVIAIIALLIGVSFCSFVYARLSLFADVYFIPVNYPAAEEASLNVALVGIIFILISFIGCVSSLFIGNLTKEEKATIE